MNQLPFEQRLSRQVSALSVQKQHLNKRIAEEMNKRLPCSMRLQRLKKLKLLINDRIAASQRRGGTQQVVAAS